MYVGSQGVQPEVLLTLIIASFPLFKFNRIYEIVVTGICLYFLYSIAYKFFTIILGATPMVAEAVYDPKFGVSYLASIVAVVFIENLLLYSKIKSSDLIAYNIIVVGIAFLSVLVPVAEVKLR